MLQYRLYFFNGSGRFVKVHEFEAAEDRAAAALAESWREGRGMELWQKGRKIRRWECD